MATVTEPIMTDATGQSIDSKLNSLLGKMDNLAAAFQPNASGIVYSNATSGLTGDDVQEAIDEMAADVSEIKQSLSDLETLEKTVSGAIVTFDDGSDLPMPKLEVAIEPQQDLHGYDHPWVGGAGKNKLPMTVDGIKAVNTYHPWSGNSTTINNVTITIETSNSGDVTGIRFNGTASADITFNLASNITIANGSYIYSNDQIVNVSNLWLSLTSPNLAITLSTQKEANITISNGSISSAYIYASSGNVFNNLVFKPMIRLASVTDGTFAPYSNICPISGWDDVNVTVCDDIDNPTVTHTYTIDLDGTRYGGTLDVVSGLMTLDRAFVDLGTLNWDKYTNSAKTYFRTSTQLPDAKKSDGETTTHNLMCSNYKEDSWSHVIDGNGYDGNICIGWNNNAYIGIYDSRYVDASASDFKTAMNGVQLVYELATPQTYQLTPTQVNSLLGVNNIWADTGDLEIIYFVNNSLVQSIYDMINVLNS